MKQEFPISTSEERVIERITFRKMFVDVFSAFNVERGLIYTIKLLFSRPGHLVRLYLFDGRYKIFNAFRLLFLTTAISLFVLYVVDTDSFFEDFSMGYSNYDDTKTKLDNDLIQQTFLDWYNLLLWIAIPIYGLFSYLFNIRMKYNFPEHIVMQTFYFSGINLITTVGLSIGLFFPSVYLFIGVFLLTFTYYLWILPGWLERRSFLFFLRNLFAFLLANIFYFIIIMIIVGGIVAYTQLQVSEG